MWTPDHIPVLADEPLTLEPCGELRQLEFEVQWPLTDQQVAFASTNNLTYIETIKIYCIGDGGDVDSRSWTSHGRIITKLNKQVGTYGGKNKLHFYYDF